MVVDEVDDPSVAVENVETGKTLNPARISDFRP